MTDPGPIGHLWIIGPGRLGLALGWELRKAGAVTSLTYRGRSERAPSHPVFAPGDAAYLQQGVLGDTLPNLILMTVPDEAIEAEAERLRGEQLPAATILHTSGVLGSDSLGALAAAGWSTGSLHPLVAVPHAVDAAPKLRGAWFGVEGSEEAVRTASAMVRALEGKVLEIASDQKPIYHAAAVLASNYLVAVISVAVRMMTRSGVSDAEAVAALAALAAGAIGDVSIAGPETALTGPILRGDLHTIELHLSRLSSDERALYSVLGREAVAIARGRGLGPETADRIIGLLEAGNS